MTRIFSTMAVVAMLLLAITLIMGLAIGEPGQQWLDYRTEINPVPNRQPQEKGSSVACSGVSEQSSLGWDRDRYLCFVGA